MTAESLIDVKKILELALYECRACVGNMPHPPILTNTIERIEQAIAVMGDGSARKDEALKIANKMAGVFEKSKGRQSSEIRDNVADELRKVINDGCTHPQAVEGKVFAAMQAIRPYLRTTEPVSVKSSLEELGKIVESKSWIVNTSSWGDCPRVRNGKDVAKAVLDAAGVPYGD